MHENQRPSLLLTLPPFLSRSLAEARPMPWAAPVIKATLLANIVMSCAGFLCKSNLTFDLQRGTLPDYLEGIPALFYSQYIAEVRLMKRTVFTEEV